MKKVARADRAFQKEIADAISAFRREVLDVIDITDLTDYAAHRVRAMRTAVKAAEDRLNVALGTSFDTTAVEAARLAIGSVDGPLADLLGRALPLVMIPEDQLAIVMAYTPDLIAGATRDMAKQIQQIFSQKMLGGISTQQARARLGQIVGPLPASANRLSIPGNVFSGTRIRTETIFRTEFNRIYATTSESRIDELASKIPGIGKVWIHQPTASRNPRASHARLHGKIIFPGNGEKFEVAGFLVDGPYDPALPASEVINCHCRVRIAYSDEIAAEQERRGKLKAPQASKVAAA